MERFIAEHVTIYIPRSVHPNHVTAFRFLILVVIVGLLFWELSYAVVLGCYVAGCLSDWLDGHLARTRNQKTEFGKRIDEIVDKLFVGGVFATLLYIGLIPVEPIYGYPLIAGLLLIREIFITWLRNCYPQENQRVSVLLLAKAKTAMLMVAFGLIIFAAATEVMLARTLGFWSLYIATFCSIFTGFQYTWKITREAGLHHYRF